MDLHDYARIKVRLEIASEDWLKAQMKKLDYIFQISTGDMPPQEILTESPEFVFAEKVAKITIASIERKPKGIGRHKKDVSDKPYTPVKNPWEKNGAKRQ